MTRVAVGVDVGGTKIGAALVSARGEVLYKQTVPSPRSPQGVDPGHVETLALLGRLETKAAEAGLEVLGAGIGVPEYVTPEGRINSRLVLAPGSELPASTRSGAPIVIDSDVRCAARAEHRLGHGRRFSSFAFASIGTGISHTLVMGGLIWPGHRGEAIALGELPVGQTLAIRADAPATVEEQASGRAIEQASGRAPEQAPGRPTVVSAPPADLLLAESVPYAAEHEPSSMNGIDTRAGRIVARALADLVHLVDPAAVILGGGLGCSAGAYIASLARHFNLLTRSRPSPPALLQTRLGNDAGAIGAGLLVHQASG